MDVRRFKGISMTGTKKEDKDQVPPLSGNVRALEIRALDRSNDCAPVIDYAEMRTYLPSVIQ